MRSSSSRRSDVLASILFLFLHTLVIPIAAYSPGQYVDPALTLPPTPDLPRARESGYVNLSSGVDIWYGQFGAPLKESIKHHFSPILFLHGGFANSQYFGQQISALIKDRKRSTVISIDSRMQGRSTGLDQPITYELMRQDVVGVLDHFNIPSATVVGWSDGGIIGLDLAINAPSRLDRLFAFGATYSPANINASIGNSPVWSDYVSRVEEEYAELSPTPGGFAELSRKINELFSELPNYTQSDMAKIPNQYQDCEGAPLIWIVDGADEEAVNRDVPTTLHNWIPASGLVILPSSSHFALVSSTRLET
jgi:pimeloyl-ACP methyl ester carboxylesterase